MNNLSNWLKNIVKNNQKLFKIYAIKIFLCVCMYKMVDISAETGNKAGVSVIRIHENYNVNKTLLLFLHIPDIS